jgi:hypothetical protein
VELELYLFPQLSTGRNFFAVCRRYGGIADTADAAHGAVPEDVFSLVFARVHWAGCFWGHFCG